MRNPKRSLKSFRGGEVSLVVDRKQVMNRKLHCGGEKVLWKAISVERACKELYFNDFTFLGLIS